MFYQRFLMLLPEEMTQCFQNIMVNIQKHNPVIAGTLCVFRNVSSLVGFTCGKTFFHLAMPFFHFGDILVKEPPTAAAAKELVGHIHQSGSLNKLVTQPDSGLFGFVGIVIVELIVRICNRSSRQHRERRREARCNGGCKPRIFLYHRVWNDVWGVPRNQTASH